MTVRAFRNAFRGLVDAWRTQRNARFHTMAAVAVVVAGLFLRLSSSEWAVIVLCIAVVMALEAVNTALEYLTDLISPTYHPLAGKAKDAAAGAVLLGALGAAVVGAVIFGPKVAALFEQF